MSLVAYGASDDSEQSETEDNEQSPIVNQKKIANDQISDEEDDYQQTVSSSSSSLFSNYSLAITNRHENASSVSSSGTSYELPPPQKREDITLEETELEEEVRQKPSELADAPKPPPKRTKQPVKITIPSLSEIPDEEDDDSKQKPVASTKKSGLFSLLPPPIHSAKKEINRPLIPHSLGKKSAPKPSAVQAKSVSSSSSSSSQVDSPSISKITTNSHSMLSSNKNITAYKGLISYDSDDDEDNDGSNSSQNFFSLGSETTAKHSESVSSTTENCNVTELSKKTVIAAVEKESLLSSDSESKAAISSPPEEEEEIVVPPEPGLTNDSPLDFCNASRFSSWSSASSSYLGGLGPSPNHNAFSSGSYASSSSYPQASSVQYNMVDAEDDNAQVDLCNQVGGTDDFQHMMDDKEFHKFHGKRKRGMGEVINFVDAKVDDYVDPSELSKHLTEETEYSSMKNKNDMPTSQQKRKKQITYLAFQAKEKEMELKNTWADNRLTKRQTQAKYGF